ncbi:MAG: tail fiber domain-containing protein [Bacteroidia bacterium]|jgi:hypothetical protein|nr:tail fiber domain-containing protein [Bacteroidia bacterium]
MNTNTKQMARRLFIAMFLLGTANEVLAQDWTLTGNSLSGTGTNPTQRLGSTNAFDLVMITNNTERMRILSGGNVGIGTNNPSSRLQVSGGQFSQLQSGSFGAFGTANSWIGLGLAGSQSFPISSVYGMAISRTGSQAYFNLVDNTSARDLVIGFGVDDNVINTSQRLRIQSIITLANATNDIPSTKDLMVFNPQGLVGVNNDPGQIAFFVDATQAGVPLSTAFRSMTILTQGSFSNPAAATFASIGQEGNSTVTGFDIIGLRAQNGNSGINCQVNANVAEITWQDLNYTNPVSATTGTEDRLTFNFRNGVPANNPTNKREMMTILANGRVGINTPTPVATGATNVAPNVIPMINYFLDVNGGVRAAGYFAFSDQRFKSNIQTIENPMDRIMKMRGATYLFRSPDMPEGTPGVQQIGFIAQELQQVVPEVVAVGDDGIYSVNYNALTPLLVEGIKVQQGTINAQQVKIDEQQQQLATQQQRIEKLEAMMANMGGNATPAGTFQDQLPVNPSLGNLQQNIPNPFNQQTVINYTVAENAGVAMLTIYDLNGRQIRSEQLNQRGAGQFTINANELAPGMYIYALIVDGKAADSKRMIVTE